MTVNNGKGTISDYKHFQNSSQTAISD